MAPIRRTIPALALLGLVLAIGLGFDQGVQSTKAPSGPTGGDIEFYARVVDRVKAGQPYYPVVADEIRALHGPLKPFLTTRPPLLATALAALPSPACGRWALRILSAATLLAWCWRLALMRLSPLSATFAFAMLASGYACALANQAYLLHEVWAGLLIALALALYRPERWGLSMALALIAAITRELAAPFLLVMAAFALVERRPREAMAWLGSVAVFGFALWRHALYAQAQFLPSDTVSIGWLGLHGWPFVLHSAIWNGLAARPWMIAVLLPLGLYGLIGARDPAIRRAAVTVFGFTAGLMIVGRPENYTWGALIAPLWPLGLIAAPKMLTESVRGLKGPLPRADRSPAIAFAPPSSAE